MDMQADPSLEYQDADEARPAKRVKLDGALDVTEAVQEEIVDDEGWDDIYGPEEPDAAEAEEAKPPLVEQTIGSVLSPSEDEHQPDLDELVVDVALPEVAKSPTIGSLPLAPTGEHEQESPEQTEGQTAQAEVEDGVPAEAIEDGDALVKEHHHITAADEPSVRMLEEVSAVNGDPNANIEGADGQTNAKGEIVQPATNETIIDTRGKEDTQGVLQELEKKILGVSDDAKPPIAKATDDAEFTAAAAAQKENAVAEWQFDSSDVESEKASDSDSSDDSSDSDSDSEGGYEMLDPATAAKILMQGEGDDEDEGKGKKGGAGVDHQPRTLNEIKEVVVPKPDVVVTDDMKITELGRVERAVENMMLIKGATPGEYQVLESGSVLCNGLREVIGVVAETLGRVQEPLYSVAFTNAKEIEDAGLEYGTKVYYVDSHSTFVFTQPLKNLKGTDASNLHDEEVAEHEMEFSDDEAEAEYKRQKKMAKKAGRGGMAAPGAGRSDYGGSDGPKSFGAPGHDSGQTYINGNDAPQQSYGGALSYDDEPADEFYSPLKRPDNLSQMIASGGSPPPPRPQRSGFDRGRGRGRGDRGRGRGGDRGRGRGDRGKGRGGFNNDRGQRGGGRSGFNGDRKPRGNDRGGPNGQGNGGYRGNAQSFPDRHNNEPSNGHRQQPLPPKPRAPQSASPPAQSTSQQHPPQYNQYQQSQQQQQSYQFNGYTFQYGNAPPVPVPAPTQHPQQTSYGYQQQAYQQQQAAATPGASIPPAGAFINPVFFQNQQLPPKQQQPGGYGGWSGQQQAQQAQQAQQQQQYAQAGQQAYGGGAGAGYAGGMTAQQQQANLAEILRKIGGQG